MKIIKIILASTAIFLASCGENKKQVPEGKNISGEVKASKEVMLTQQQFDALDMEIDTLTSRLMSGYIEANGHLEVPPQSEAMVTPVIGGNISSIKVIEGDAVEKGSVLAYLSHPDIVKVQIDYVNTASNLKFLEKDYSRQKRLYDGGVGSGETFQKVESELEGAKAHLKGMEAQLRQLHINPETIKNGDIQQQIPVLSPIKGAVQAVNIKTGQFVQSQTNMFEIINTDDVHVDLMVFEKDVPKVKEGQKVFFSTSAQPGKEMVAEILSISKNFEQDPKALHVHAEIDNRSGQLVPGMYVKGRIAIEDNKTLSFPEAAIAKNGDRFYIFSAEREGEQWSFKPVEITTGVTEDKWTTVNFLEITPEKMKFAFNNAYYLMAEMNKGDGGHSH
ncbi:efflux RND transporter periplasmic adaptor subunit [Christiangramia aquimixticola]|uniref:efflux RND transporter periplasmic adaptor subunit n=1 Tax=Christiangramia aquimixticola TaxID=1697558 RepID=UPI003AA93326